MRLTSECSESCVGSDAVSGVGIGICPVGAAWQGLGPAWPRLPLPTGPHVGGTLSWNQEAYQVQGPYLLDINTDVDVNQLGAWSPRP